MKKANHTIAIALKEKFQNIPVAVQEKLLKKIQLEHNLASSKHMDCDGHTCGNHWCTLGH